jgi:hypothetical protein
MRLGDVSISRPVLTYGCHAGHTSAACAGARALRDLTAVSKHGLASSSYLATATAASLYDALIPQATASLH